MFNLLKIVKMSKDQNNQSEINDKLKDIVTPNELSLLFGKPVKEVEVTIPYLHSVEIEEFLEKYPLVSCGPLVTNKNFPYPTDTLIAGKRYTFKFIPIITEDDGVSVGLIFKLIDQHKALMGGLDALISAYSLCGFFPKGKCVISFDNKERLYKSDTTDNHYVPFLHSDEDTEVFMDTVMFESTFSAQFMVLLICEA